MGTSGHPLVGPWLAIIVVLVVLVIQALLFADGGITALGSNILLMGIVTVAVGYGISRLVVSALPRRPIFAAPAATLAR